MKARMPVTSSRGIIRMTSTEAQNGFGRVLDMVAKGRTVLITRRNVPKAVLMPVDQYEALARTDVPDLDALTAEFDEMLARMQGSEVRAGIRAGLSASPAELGRVARAAAERGG
ncbi:MAG TPA: type II toxin-antitoxin system Phd/YefM family antitoxin [Longimicrobium sp.]|nr:type II toxin-antitoxin system Phd/YefM family antitoxin [Longimicrobium sp.]